MKIIAYILLTIVVIQSILPHSAVYAIGGSQNPVELLKLTPVKLNVTPNGGAASSPVTWTDVGYGHSAIAFVLESHGETDADTYKIPMLYNDMEELRLHWVVQQPGGEPVTNDFTGSPESYPSGATDVDAYKPLMTGVTYYISIFYRSPDELNAAGSGFNTLSVEYYSDVCHWTSPSQQDITPPGTGEIVVVPPDNPTTVFDAIEALIAVFINAIAGGINLLISVGMGKIVTIDNIIFNEFDQTRLDFFVNNANQPVIRSGLVESLVNVINKWYGHFRDIASVCYLVILLYIGIVILLGSTGKKVSAYKELLMSWVVGVAILFMFPFVMKYAIIINNSLVKMVADARPLIFRGAVVNTPAPTNVTGD
jgi:hypothetical protein